MMVVGSRSRCTRPGCPRFLADVATETAVEGERIVKRGTRVVRCAPPRPTPHRVLNPLCYSSIQAATIPLPKLAPGKSSCRHRLCWAVRYTASKPRSPGPDELVAVGRDAECRALAHAVQWHCERRGVLNGHRRRRPLTYANLRYPESRSESLRFPWPTGRSRSWISAGGWVASTAVNGSRILYVCRACRGTTHALPGSRRTIWPSLCSSARPEIT